MRGLSSFRTPLQKYILKSHKANIIMKGSMKFFGKINCNFFVVLGV